MLFRASNSKMQSDFFLLLVVALKVAFPKYIKVEALLLTAAVLQCFKNCEKMEHKEMSLFQYLQNIMEHFACILI